MKKLSILIPVFNEEKSVTELLDRVVAVELVFQMTKQLVIVNDASTDKTAEMIGRFQVLHPQIDICCVHHSRNQGKGASLATAIRNATGDVLVVQDADLEYDPRDYNAMLSAMQGKNADVVYGSRFLSGRRVTTPVHRLGNAALTWFSNVFTGLGLTDVYTCYKMFKPHVFKQVNLEELRFGFDPEITAKVARIPGICLMEVPVSYVPRGFADGKKVGVRDGFRALWCSMKYGRLSAPVANRPPCSLSQSPLEK